MGKGKSKKAKGKKENAVGLGFRRCCLGNYFCLFTFAFLLSTPPASAQDDPLDLAPPPLKTVSRDERSRLDAQTEIKPRTKLALELMNARLAAAEKLNDSEDFDGMFRELGVFHGLMDNSLAYLQNRDKDSSKVLDNFKRIEIGLRGFMPRLEAIRRDLPLRYEDYVSKLLKFVREARTRASDPLFADTVVPRRKPEE